MAHRILARTVHGLEWVAAAEIASALPAARSVGLGRRDVTLTLPELTPALWGLRTVDDVFLVVGSTTGGGTTKADLPGLGAAVAALDWRAALAALRAARELPPRPRFDVVASLEGRHSYNRFAVEDAAGTALAPVVDGVHLARSPSGGPVGTPELTVRVFVRDGSALVALRLAAAPLHRRAYKQDTGPGTLHPPVAAALVRLAGPGGTLLDPFCGDGTIAVEAALAYPARTVLAADLDPRRLDHTRRNATRASVPVRLVRADAARPPWRPGSVDTVVSNPPWGVAVAGAGDLGRSLARFWHSLAGVLSSTGRACLLADAGLGAPEALGRNGFTVAVTSRVRLAGRVSDVVFCSPPGAPGPELPTDLAAWRRRALDEGVVFRP